MIIEDTKKIETTMNGNAYNAAQFAHTLRTALYSEHFGLTPAEVQDPLSNELELKILQLTKVCFNQLYILVKYTNLPKPLLLLS